MLRRLTHGIGLCLLVAPQCWASESAPFPQWVEKAIAAEKKRSHPGSFEEATYEGKRVFQWTRGDIADTGDEHVLYSEDGKEICKFGGLVGHVTSGGCDVGRIEYVRTLYPN